MILCVWKISSALSVVVVAGSVFTGLPRSKKKSVERTHQTTDLISMRSILTPNIFINGPELSECESGHRLWRRRRI